MSESLDGFRRRLHAAERRQIGELQPTPGGSRGGRAAGGTASSRRGRRREPAGGDRLRQRHGRIRQRQHRQVLAGRRRRGLVRADKARGYQHRGYCQKRLRHTPLRNRFNSRATVATESQRHGGAVTGRWVACVAGHLASLCDAHRPRRRASLFPVKTTAFSSVSLWPRFFVEPPPPPSLTRPPRLLFADEVRRLVDASAS